MRTHLIFLITLSFSLVGCDQGADANRAEERRVVQQEQTSTNASQQLDAILERIYAANEPGVTVAVVQQGNVIYHTARGMADLELEVAMQPEHVLKIGSITKQFTAAAVLRLAEQGKLTMQTKVGDLLPNFHEPELTVHQLLNHTSGLPSYTDDGEYMMGDGIRADVTAEEIIALTSDQPLDFVPGEDWRYSNSGYVVLGAIIEKLSGMSWHEYIATELIDPLGLAFTGYFNEAEIVAGRVPGYMYENGFTNAPFISMTQPHAAGAFYSTAQELARWQYALHTGQVLEPASYAQMIDASQGLNSYAYALDIISLRGTKMISHGGGIHGFSAFGLWLPEHQLSVVALTNRMGPGMGSSGTAMRIAAQLMDQPFPLEQASVNIDAAELQALVGTYRVDEDTLRTIFIKDDVLYSKRGDGRPYAARYVGNDQFVFADTLVYFEVVRDDTGSVTGLNYYQLEQAEPEFSEKVSDEVQVRTAIELTDAQAQRLEGDYQLQPNFVISIRHTDAGLTAQATGQSAFLVDASSADVLFNEEFGIVMEFDLSDEGPATQLNLLQGGQKQPAPRIDSSTNKEDE
ncbi:serine hydrolase domain-containing protein [Pseudidiomarina homiensis]|uniref:serine hydrolase domain-containing protein n=1 Tax=Pseudidiomarina homiensis TaxID=364198 RepID=UPI00215AEF7C|nr:beta-lactamase family protein [Pseudidiomarina homiensis]